jgi:hypothetical protein
VDTGRGSVPFARPSGYASDLLKREPRLNGSLPLSENLSVFRKMK